MDSSRSAAAACICTVCVGDDCAGDRWIGSGWQRAAVRLRWKRWRNAASAGALCGVWRRACSIRELLLQTDPHPLCTAAPEGRAVALVSPLSLFSALLVLVVGSLRQAKYGDSFIRGNNILYISTQKRKAKATE